MARLLGFLLMAVSVLLPAPASAAKRFAFVAGIDHYDNLDAVNQLKKAVNDAHAVADALQSLGYRVNTSENATRRDFLRQWQVFLNALEPGDETAFFYAGHGVEIDGQNFLLPRDTPNVAPGEEEVMKAEGLALNALLDQVRDRHPQVSLFVIDACRDNPFFDKRGRSVGGARGLTLIEPPSGTFVMFSAGKNETALDRLSDNDPNPNSIYTRTLLPRLKSPGNITEIARDVRRQVVEIARGVSHVQTPAYYDELVGDFCPAGCGAAVAAASDAAAKAPVPATTKATPVQSTTAETSAEHATPKREANVGQPAEPKASPSGETAKAEPRTDEVQAAPPPEARAVEQPATAESKVAALEQAPLTGATQELFGMSLAATESTDSNGRGVVVLSVGSASHAADKGITPGDRILEVSGVAVTQPGDIVEALEVAKVSGRASVLLLVAWKDQRRRFVALRLDRMATAAAPPSDEGAAPGFGPLPGRVAALKEPPTPHAPAITPKQSTGKLRRLREMSLEDRFENCAAFSPDGTLLATGLDNGKIVIWDAATGKSLRTLEAEGGVLSVAFSPDGRFLISGETTETIRIWDPASGQLIRTVTNATTHVRSIALSPDGRTFATADAGKDIALWDASAGARIGTLNPDETHLSVYSVAYSPDGTRLAAGTWTDVQLWNPATGALVWRSKTEDFARTETLAFSPDGSRMIAGDDLGRVRFIDTASGETLKTVKVPLARKANVFDDDIHGLVWTPDGQMVIAATRDQIHLLSADGQVLKTVKHKLVGTIAISPAGDRLAVAGLGIAIFEP